MKDKSPVETAAAAKRENRNSPDLASNRRRQLVQGGLATGTTLTALSGPWTEPIVEKVLLPAHAQTTGDPSTSPACTDILVLPGTTLFCDDAAIERSTVYTFTFESGCLSVTTQRFSDGCGPGPEVLDAHISVCETVVPGDGMEIRYFGVVFDEFFFSNSCETPTTGETSPFHEFVVDGVLFVASWTITNSATPPSISMSEITVSPQS